MMSRPVFTVCIPAYNRAVLLAPLLDSILAQDFSDYEILICEDHSPERNEIKLVVEEYQKRSGQLIRYVENELNLGYDGNIRELVKLSHGHYCVFMGNDDLMCMDALMSISDVINRVPNCGVVVRTYATFDQDPSALKQVFRYFPDELVITPGAQAITVAYRRSVVIPGMTIHRDSAEKFSNNEFDGTLLYQLYLVGRILATRCVAFTPKIIALRRDGVPPDFGNSASERGRFVPRDQTPDSSVHFMKGMLRIARYLEGVSGLPVFKAIRADIANYSYPILSIQAQRPKLEFLSYAFQLGRLGFFRSLLFYFYLVSLLILGPRRLDAMIAWIKLKLGYTPMLGGAFWGKR